jgi:UDP:flavonoid glycosyltransferase YjiC (YdhE family)
VPVIGIASNLDQFLNMQAIEAAGAGVLIRGDRVTDAGLRVAVERVLRAASHRLAAQSLAGSFERFRAAERFGAFLGGGADRLEAD